jgi:hypothetical protein
MMGMSQQRVAAANQQRAQAQQMIAGGIGDISGALAGAAKNTTTLAAAGAGG